MQKNREKSIDADKLVNFLAFSREYYSKHGFISFP
jgi:hypothetical protein